MRVPLRRRASSDVVVALNALCMTLLLWLLSTLGERFRPASLVQGGGLPTRLVQALARFMSLVQGGAQLSNRAPFGMCGPP